MRSGRSCRPPVSNWLSNNPPRSVKPTAPCSLVVPLTSAQNRPFESSEQDHSTKRRWDMPTGMSHSVLETWTLAETYLY